MEAYSATHGNSRRAEFGDITGPLAQFQAKKVDKQGWGEIIHSINSACETPRLEDRAKHVFDALWPELEKAIAGIPSEPPSEKHRRPQNEIIEELVTGVRGLDSRFRDLERTIGEQDPRPGRRPHHFHPRMLEELAMTMAEEPDDPLVILMLAGLLRDDLPWLSEVMVEVYREVRAGDEKAARRAVQRLHLMTRNLRRGPLMELSMGWSRDAEMWMLELPHLVDHLLRRYIGQEAKAEEVTAEPAAAD